MPILTADRLAETHPMLPDDFRRSMGGIRRDGGPWPCGACGGPSYLVYRCSACGHNLCGGGTKGREMGAQR